MAGKLKSSKSGGSKKQVTRALRSLVRLYSSFPSEVVSLLLDFLLKASDWSNSNGVDSLVNSEVNNPDSSKPMTGTIDDWKLVVTKFSSKEPGVFLIMLKTVLEMIEAREAKKSEIGSHCQDHEICKTEHLSSLVPWLVGKLKEVKSTTKIHLSSAETDVVSKETLNILLRKCLSVLAPGNNPLMDSALLLAQMMGNNSLVERLKKFCLISLPKLNYEENTTHTALEPILHKQEESINKAAEKLEHLKLCRIKKRVNSGDIEKKENIWTVAKSWNPCPIGMLPSSLGSSGSLPILDRSKNEESEVQESSERKEKWEMKHCSGKREASIYDIEMLEKSNSVKKMKKTVEDDNGRLDIQSDLSKPIEGRLLIGGIWKKIDEEELRAIESSIRILV